MATNRVNGDVLREYLNKAIASNARKTVKKSASDPINVADIKSSSAADIKVSQEDVNKAITDIMKTRVDVKALETQKVEETKPETLEVESPKAETPKDISKPKAKPVNTEPTKEQLAKVKILKNSNYQIPDENITVLEDGSIKVKIKNSSAVIVFDSNGEIVSAKNVTGVMMKNCLLKGNKEAINEAYKNTKGEGAEKADNFNKGTFDIKRDKNGNLKITFKKGYEKPTESGTTSDASSKETKASVVTTVDIDGNIVQVDADELDYTETVEEEDETEEIEDEAEVEAVTAEAEDEDESPAVSENEEVEDTATPQPTEAPKETATPEVVEETAVEEAEETATPIATEEADDIEDVKEDEEAKEEPLIDNKTLDTIMMQAADILGIEGYNEEDITMSQCADNANNIKIEFKTPDGKVHQIIYNSKNKVIVKIDGEQAYKTTVATQELLDNVPNLSIKKDEERSKNGLDVYNHNNISFLVSREGTNITSEQVEIDGKKVDGVLISEDKLKTTISQEALNKIKAMIGEGDSSTTTLYVQNNYFYWGSKTDIKVIRLQDYEVDGQKQTKSVIYTFDSNGDIKKIEYNGVEIDKNSVANAAKIVGKSIDYVLFNSVNVEEGMMRSRYEIKNDDGSTTSLDVSHQETLASNDTYGENLSYEQMVNIYKYNEEALEKIKNTVTSFGVDIANAKFSMCTHYNLEELQIEGADKYYEAIICEVNGYKFIFEYDYPEYCTIIDPKGNINRDYEPEW